MTDKLIIEIGEPGHSDLVLYEIENFARQIGADPRQAAVMLIGMGLQAAEQIGMFKRATPMGTGLDPNWRPPTPRGQG